MKKNKKHNFSKTVYLVRVNPGSADEFYSVSDTIDGHGVDTGESDNVVATYELAGFKKGVRVGIAARLGDSVRADARLELGGMVMPDLLSRSDKTRDSRVAPTRSRVWNCPA